MPPIAQNAFSRNNPEHWTATQKIALGAFVGSARWITTPHGNAAPDEATAHSRSPASVQESFAAAEEFGRPEAPDTELGFILAAVADDVHRITAAVCAGIMADFAGRVLHARRYLPRNQIAGAIAAIKQMRAAALAAARQNAKAEVHGRRKAAIAARRPSTLKRGAVFPSNRRS